MPPGKQHTINVCEKKQIINSLPTTHTPDGKPDGKLSLFRLGVAVLKTSSNQARNRTNPNHDPN